MSKSSKYFPSGAVGRGDLIRLLSYFPDAPHDILAGLLGYKRIPLKPTSSGEDVDGGKNDEFTGRTPDGVLQKGWNSTLTPRFWHVNEREFLNDEHVVPSQIPNKKATSQPVVTRKPAPLKEPLIPWKRLWPFLKGVLEGEIYSRQPDEREALRILSKGEAFNSIPLKKRKTWASFSQIIMDTSKRLSVFRDDFHLLVDGVEELTGSAHLQVCRLPYGPLNKAYYPKKEEFKEINIDQYGAPLLILSDLGSYGSSYDRAQWLRFGESLYNTGIRPVVLNPAPQSMWDDKLTKLFRQVCWDTSVNLPPIHGSKGGVMHCDVDGGKQDFVELLLSLLSPAIYIDLGLVRAMRKLLPEASAEVEAFVWGHSAVDATYKSFAFKRSHLQYYRDKFNKLEVDFKEKALKVIEDCHTFLPSEVQLEERLSQHVLRRKYAPETSIPEDVKEYLEWLNDCLFSGGGDRGASTLAWVKRMSWRQLDEVRAVEGAEQLCAAAAKAFERELMSKNSAELPTFLKEKDIVGFSEKEHPFKSWEVRQIGTEFYIFDESSHLLQSYAQGSHITYIRGQRLLKIEAQNKVQQRTFADGLCIPTSANEVIVLSSSSESITLSSITKPDWADSIYRNSSGLYATLLLNDSKIKHVLSSEIKELNRFSNYDKSSKDNVEKGFWLNLSQLNKTFEIGLPDISWAENYGFDQYGLYADLNIEGVIQRMRWIHPGTFMMGSPEDEPARHDNEIQHEVTLTKGYWLADTPCTQELWEKVMGNNRSEFKGNAQLPVERVSWDDCQEFIQTVNKRFQELNLKFPTEAEWEYGCRAGTDTSFSFGVNITTEQVNYDGSHPYNDGPKGVSRGKTVLVKELSCNQWGLYQMHGNVWEWCADWYGEYPERSIENPQGSTDDGLRVLRGGGWSGNGRFVRSAIRIRRQPDSRDGCFGFRFSLGQKG
ncbi:formylglycine-generating enzyme family protein [Maridesulfovibrio frigidus]|uniref:formylglycine-generating enzyme family protein n=1 Tax=Maridesulfovibrio frigidus TaxID=340956 RepID=UPI000AA03277|nr:formylglycine-generating enzyme family protein [Maridesulfovibrio frigidus]